MPSHYQGPPREVLALGTFIKLTRAANSLAAALAPGLAQAGLTDSQFGVLEALVHLGPMHQCDLARRILKTSGNLTMVVGNLERRGLVRRQRSADDRRFILVHLTAAGERLIRRSFSGHAARIAELMSVLSEADQRTLGRLCRDLGIRAAAAMGSRTSG